MSMAGAIVFLVGLIGLGSYIGFLKWEAKQPTRSFVERRKEWDRQAAKMYRILVFGEIPYTIRANIIAYVRNLAHEGVHLLTALVRAIEAPLARTSHRIQSARDSENNITRSPSPFLKDISVQGERDGKSKKNSV